MEAGGHSPGPIYHLPSALEKQAAQFLGTLAEAYARWEEDQGADAGRGGGGA